MSFSTIYGYDSFKSGTTFSDETLGRWTASNNNATLAYNSTNGRFGGACLRCNGSNSNNNFCGLRRSGIGNNATMVLHFPMRVSALGGANIEVAGFWDGSTQQITLVMLNDGTFQIKRGTNGGTVLATSTTASSPNVYYVYELKVTFHGSAGSIELRRNGTAIIGPTSSLNTSNSGNAYANGYSCGIWNSQSTQPGANFDYEHFICCDDFIGDKRFFTNLPTGNPTAVWTPNASTNLSRVQEAQEDGDSTYVSSSNPGDIDYYSYAALPTGVTGILAVITSIWARKDDAGTRQVRTKIKQGSTVVNGATVSVSSTYAEYYDVAYVDPVSGVAFVKSDVDSLVTGFEEVA